MISINNSNRAAGRSELAFDKTAQPGWRELNSERVEEQMAKARTDPDVAEANWRYSVLGQFKPADIGERRMKFGMHFARLVTFKLGYQPSDEMTRALSKEFSIELTGESDFEAVWVDLVIKEQTEQIDHWRQSLQELQSSRVLRPDAKHYHGYQEYLQIVERLRIGDTILYITSLERNLEDLYRKGYDLDPKKVLQSRVDTLISDRENAVFRLEQAINKSRKLLALIPKKSLDEVLDLCETIDKELSTRKQHVRENVVKR